MGSAELTAGGDLFFVDENESGSARRFEIAEVFWGRLVDIYDVVSEAPAPEDRVASAQPLLVDFVIDPNIVTDNADYRLETNPVTQRQRLIILRQAPDFLASLEDFEQSEFSDLLRAADEGVLPIEAKNDDGTSAPPFSFAARNAVVGLRFNDLLLDGAAEAANLIDTVRVFASYPPITPFPARIFFDANHGAIAGNGFHSSRVLIDFTITEAESNNLGLPSNALGLPASLTSSLDPNVSVRVPTEEDIASGQLSVLRNLRGFALTTVSNGPMDPTSPTVDIVRALRAGNESEGDGGFLNDDAPPRMLGRWDFSIAGARVDTQAEFSIDVQFSTLCQDTLFGGQVLEIGASFLEVVVLNDNPVSPDAGGLAAGVLVRSADPNDPVELADLGVGTIGAFLPTYDSDDSTASPACWLEFTPDGTLVLSDPNDPMSPLIWTDVSTTSVATVRFSEPMNPSTVSALDAITFVRGDSASATPGPDTIVAGVLQAGDNLSQFQFQPTAPFAHVNGVADPFHLAVSAAFPPQDLAGNPIQADGLLPAVDLTIDPLEEDEDNGAIVLQLNSVDETGAMDPIDPIADLRGQIFYDFAEGSVRPRDVLFSSYHADTDIPVPAQMTPFPLGIIEPLLPQGAKTQMLYRYCDFGWKVNDESKMNIDVIGLSWAPFGGIVSSEFYPEFEILFGHSARLPDEGVDAMGIPVGTTSGLLPGPGALFTDNFLGDPLSPTKVIHPRSFGYDISPVDRFTAPSGTIMLPYPINRTGAPRQSFLWRDTAAVGLGDPGAGPAGLPLRIEVNAGVAGDEQLGQPVVNDGSYFPAGQRVPTLGLPLLVEFRCVPTTSELGLNSYTTLFPTLSPTIFEVFSTGGIDVQGNRIDKHPDNQPRPTGGFNPNSIPAGQPTAGSSTVLWRPGLIDTVTRVSRAHTIWLDTGNLDPDYIDVVIEPDPQEYPSGTSVLIDYRGVQSFQGALSTEPFDASMLNPYGDLPGPNNNVVFEGTGAWVSSIQGIDGARYLQARLTWINNVDSRLYATVSALGFVFENN